MSTITPKQLNPDAIHIPQTNTWIEWPSRSAGLVHVRAFLPILLERPYRTFHPDDLTYLNLGRLLNGAGAKLQNVLQERTIEELSVCKSQRSWTAHIPIALSFKQNLLHDLLLPCSWMTVLSRLLDEQCKLITYPTFWQPQTIFEKSRVRCNSRGRNHKRNPTCEFTTVLAEYVQSKFCRDNVSHRSSSILSLG